MMRTRIILVVSLLLSSNIIIAQDWHLGGNTLPLLNPALWRLGSNNSIPVIFETNNTEWGRITVGGLWGIGTPTPGVKFHVVGGTDAQLNGGGFIVAGATNS